MDPPGFRSGVPREDIQPANAGQAVVYPKKGRLTKGQRAHLR